MNAADVLRAGLNPTCLAVAVAYRTIVDDGEEPTVEKVMALAQLGRSTIYEARKQLDQAFPGWRDDLVQPNGQLPVESATPEPESAVLDNGAMALDPGPPDRTTEAQDLAEQEDVALWRAAVSTQLAATAGVRSWDLYGDVYSPAWDTLAKAGVEDPGEYIALTAHYVESVLGEPVEGQGRALVARMVREFGKAALYGWQAALKLPDVEPAELHRYARVVAQRTVRELRGREETVTPSETEEAQG